MILHNDVQSFIWTFSWVSDKNLIVLSFFYISLNSLSLLDMTIISDVSPLSVTPPKIIISSYDWKHETSVHGCYNDIFNFVHSFNEKTSIVSIFLVVPLSYSVPPNINILLLFSTRTLWSYLLWLIFGNCCHLFENDKLSCISINSQLFYILLIVYYPAITIILLSIHAIWCFPLQLDKLGIFSTIIKL